MEIQKSILKVTGYLQAPFEMFRAQLYEPVPPRDYTQFFLKVLTVALAAICYPVFGTLYLVGRMVEWIIAKTVEEAPVIEQADATAVKTHSEIFSKIQQTTNALLRSKKPHKVGSIPLPTKEVIEMMKKAYINQMTPENLPPGLTVIQAGCHYCFFYDKTPDMVYKTSTCRISQKEAEEYVDQADRARKLCEEDHLFLLFVPKSRAVKLADEEYIIVQEKANTDADFYHQRGLFRALLQSLGSKGYMRELHRQLGIFIAKFKFSDVKYNNIPITEEGYVALFDLDESGAVSGFLSGGSVKEDGLLSDLPEDLQREVFEAAKPHLTTTEIKCIEARMEAKKALATKRWKKVDAYYKYAKKQEIKTPDQKLSIQAEQLLDLSAAERSLALALVEKINTNNTEHKKWVSLRMARLCNVCTYAGSVYNDHSHLFRSGMPQALERVAKHLKELGAIYAYKLTDNDQYLKVYS